MGVRPDPPAEQLLGSSDSAMASSLMDAITIEHLCACPAVSGALGEHG